jgi:hypothetical protein
MSLLKVGEENNPQERYNVPVVIYSRGPGDHVGKQKPLPSCVQTWDINGFHDHVTGEQRSFQ